MQAELSVDGWQPNEDDVVTRSQRLVSDVLSDTAEQCRPGARFTKYLTIYRKIIVRYVVNRAPGIGCTGTCLSPCNAAVVPASAAVPVWGREAQPPKSWLGLQI